MNLADLIRAEGDTAARPGQMTALHELAWRVEKLEHELKTTAALLDASRRLNNELIVGLDQARAEAWDQGHAASERDWQLTFDLTTPDEERQPLANPYREA